jgi:hypothetical protein
MDFNAPPPGRAPWGPGGEMGTMTDMGGRHAVCAGKLMHAERRGHSKKGIVGQGCTKCRHRSPRGFLERRSSTKPPGVLGLGVVMAPDECVVEIPAAEDRVKLNSGKGLWSHIDQRMERETAGPANEIESGKRRLSRACSPRLSRLRLRSGTVVRCNSVSHCQEESILKHADAS